MKNFLSVFKNLYYYSFNLCIVYFCEYAIITFISDTITNNYIYSIKKNSLYEILQIVYQTGVFLSRSTLESFTINRLHLITCGQITLLIIFICYAILFQPILLILFGTMFIVGIFGGL